MIIYLLFFNVSYLCFADEFRSPIFGGNIMHLKGNFKTEMQCANTPHTYMSIRGLRWVNCSASSTYGFNVDVIP